MFELVHVACAWVWSWVSAMEMDSDAFFFQLSTRKKRTIATHLERSGRHLWMNLKMEMALWFPASLGIVTNLEVSPSKKTCAFGEGYEDCRLQIGASNCGSSYQFIVNCPVTNRPILTFKHLLYLFRNYGFRNSQFRTCHSITTTSLLNYTSTFIIHGLPPRRMFRKQFEIATPSDVTTPVVPTVESPKNPATPRGEKKGSWLWCLGGTVVLVMWWTDRM